MYLFHIIFFLHKHVPGTFILCAQDIAVNKTDYTPSLTTVQSSITTQSEVKHQKYVPTLLEWAC